MGERRGGGAAFRDFGFMLHRLISLFMMQMQIMMMKMSTWLLFILCTYAMNVFDEHHPLRT